MLRLVVVGCTLMIVMGSLAASPRVDPRETSPSPSEVTQRVAGPPALMDAYGRVPSPRAFVYRPCRTMTWVKCPQTLTEQP
jgi:hypothetical protein